MEIGATSKSERTAIVAVQGGRVRADPARGGGNRAYSYNSGGRGARDYYDPGGNFSFEAERAGSGPGRFVCTGCLCSCWSGILSGTSPVTALCHSLGARSHPEACAL